MSKIRLLSVFGTRPDAIKMCPLVLALDRDERTESIVCVTAQHREMLDQVLGCFGVRPDYDLNIMKPRQTLTTITEAILEKLEPVLTDAAPDIVLVHGDTSTSFVAALCAFYQKIPVGHVEAGLRTFDRYSPFPEEMNRRLTGRLATLHFAPTELNRENLAREGITDGVTVTGNTVIDSMKYTVREDYTFEDETLRGIDFADGKTVLLTAHRRENLGAPMENICRAVQRLIARYPELRVIWPVHLN
ncbi:MAG: UDP-N-acetylglucosamine 2-epimerase (non-hydrolyzing), partial [Eubacteriales bacterium]|nr:UDP-N-acetylglucosamine 2-epimerase (non-hydrolyzing) [Eubacteriales bacterium]